MLKTVISLSLVLSLSCVLLGAQEKGKVGLAFAYPTTVGLIWHVTDGFALRPEFGFGRTSHSDSSGTTDGFSIESTGNTYTVGLSALVYLHRWDELSVYASPRLLYNRIDSHGTTVAGATTLTYEASSSDQTYSGSLGLQYGLSKRFSIFGELGYEFTSVGSVASAATTSLTLHTQGLRSALGMVLYLK